MFKWITRIIIFGKEDIYKECKYCKNTGSKNIFHAAYGYECIIQSKHRNMNRCEKCYFGHNKYK